MGLSLMKGICFRIGYYGDIDLCGLDSFTDFWSAVIVVRFVVIMSSIKTVTSDVAASVWIDDQSSY
jgi:hypothetical protein